LTGGNDQSTSRGKQLQRSKARTKRVDDTSLEIKMGQFFWELVVLFSGYVVANKIIADYLMHKWPNEVQKSYVVFCSSSPDIGQQKRKKRSTKLVLLPVRYRILDNRAQDTNFHNHLLDDLT
tara:strand:- start:1247 stop:1612 length:366 start_codon:yes stop_codon:yes gene_type:complete